MKIRIYPMNTLLFLDDNEVAVILQGKITIYSHILDLDNPKIIAEYGQGGIIGHSDTDKGMCRHPEYWVYTKTSLELCIFTKENFDVSIWLQINSFYGICKGIQGC